MPIIEKNEDFRKLAEEFMAKIDEIVGHENIQYLVLIYNGEEQASFGMTCRACAAEACGIFILHNRSAKHDGGHGLELNADGSMN